MNKIKKLTCDSIFNFIIMLLNKCPYLEKFNLRPNASVLNDTIRWYVDKQKLTCCYYFALKTEQWGVGAEAGDEDPGEDVLRPGIQPRRAE